MLKERSKDVAGVVYGQRKSRHRGGFTVEFDSDRASLKDLIGAVDDSGYKTGLASITLNVGGMTCASCVVHVEHALRDVDGVLSVNVNLASEQAAVEYLPGVGGAAGHAPRCERRRLLRGGRGRGRGRPGRRTSRENSRDRRAAAPDARGLRPGSAHIRRQFPRAGSRGRRPSCRTGTPCGPWPRPCSCGPAGSSTTAHGAD